MADNLPSKKQRELLNFIQNFIQGNGYGPTYREIMRGLGYKSVSTVAIHVDNLIAKGLLAKKDHSARSLELAVVGEKDSSDKDQALTWLSSREAALRARGDIEAADKIAEVVQILKRKQD